MAIIENKYIDVSGTFPNITLGVGKKIVFNNTMDEIGKKIKALEEIEQQKRELEIKMVIAKEKIKLFTQLKSIFKK